MQSSVETGEFGKRLIVRGPWNDELEAAARADQVAELVLDTPKGWLGSNIAFVCRLPQLRVLEVDHLTIADLSPISSLPNLVVLRLDTPRVKVVPDFSALQNLRMFVLAYWMPGSESAFNCHNLERLLIYKYPFEDMTPLSKLTKLDSLSFLNTYRLKSVRSIRALTNMEYLGYFLCPKLTDVAEVAELKKMKELAFDTCKKAKPFEVVAELKDLRSLDFSNCGPINSIAALRNTPKLEEFHIAESTNVLDGDLFPITSLQRLRSVAFQDRKHYSHKWDYFEGRGAGQHGRGGPRKRFGTFPDPNYEPLVAQQ